MRLDHTFIAIRERGMLEICDLALPVVRYHFRPLLALLFLGAAPWAVVNWLLTNWLAVGIFASDYAVHFFWLSTLLVISQAQIGTSLITSYLGQIMFVGRVGVFATMFESWRLLPKFWWLHGVVRLVAPVLLVVWLTWQADEDTLLAYGYLLLPLLILITMLVRALRPFVSEMILLEHTPIRTLDSSRVNFNRRSASLHGSVGSELFGRFILTCLFFPLLTFTFYSMFVLTDSTLNLQSSLEFPLSSIYWPFALWLTAGFAAVVRFLSYLDIRIRQEGWAVELKMRAEGQRLSAGEWK